MIKMSIGQRKYFSEVLGNFSLAWLVGSVISPFFTGSLFSGNSWLNSLVGLINAVWAFLLGFRISKEVEK